MTLVNAETGEVVTGEIVTGSALVLPEDAAVLDAVADPGAYCLAALDRAKSWLALATTTDLPDLVEAKARAEAIRTYTAQKELGEDAVLSSTEIVRRAERRIGQLIREGQESGQIRKRGEGARDADQPADDIRKLSPKSFGVKGHDLSGGGGQPGIYDITDDITDDEFEEAVGQAKAEKNLSRANVARNIGKGKAAARTRVPLIERLDEVRKLAAAGNSSRQIATKMGVGEENLRAVCRREGIGIPADKHTAGSRRIDSNRIVRETVSALEGIVIGLGHANAADLDPAEVEAWATSLKSSIRDVNRFIKEMAQ